MENDTVKAIIAALRADATFNGYVSGRFYPESQVPPDASFPRCYVGYETPRGGWQSGMRWRYVVFRVVFATSTRSSRTASDDAAVMEQRADVVLNQGVSAPHLTVFRSCEDRPAEPPRPQSQGNSEFIDRTTRWEAWFEY